MHHDPISDFLTRVRNANSQRHRYVDVPFSKQKEKIAQVLLDQQFISEVIVNKEKRVLRIVLRYTANRTPVVNALKRVSKPGLRKYIKSNEIPKILGGLGMAVISTNQGILEGEAAREQKLGGEVLCYIW